MRRVARWMLPVAALALLAAGCAKPYRTYDTAFQVFESFRSRYLAPAVPARGLATHSSLVYQSGKRRVRILIDFWGDFDRPLRMDAWSSVGGSLAHIIEDGQGLAAYYPDQARVYTHADPVTGARLLGLPFPFSLADLADVLSGRFGPLVPDRYSRAQAGPGDGFTYHFAEGDVERLVLDGNGRPVELTGRLNEFGDMPWPRAENVFTVGFEGYDAAIEDAGLAALPPLADTLTMRLPGDRSGVLRIRHRELKVGPWPEGALSMKVPSAVVWQLLDDAPRDWATGAVMVPEPERTGDEE